MGSRDLVGVSVALAAVAVLCAGCFQSHDGDDAVTPPPPGEYEVGPAPGEGTLCASLPEAPPGCGTGGAGICAADTLRLELARARPGDVVRVGRCRVSASLRVPAGVTLTGVDPEASIVAAPRGRPAVVLAAEAAPSVARCLTVEANAEFGVQAEGSGEARVEHVTIRAATGGGISADGVGRLSLHGLDLIGPVTPENADMLPLDPTPADVGTHGLALTEVGEVTIYGTTITGFALFGMLAVDSSVTLRGAELRDNLGTGVMFLGAPVCARSLTSQGTLQGSRLVPAYGVVLADGAELHAVDLHILEGQGIGLLQSGSSLDVEDLVVEQNDGGGVWVQESGQTLIHGAGTRIVDNTFVGLFVCQSSGLSISDAEISRTRKAVRLSGEVGTIEVGAGLTAGATTGIRLTDLHVCDNETVGIVLDLATEPAPEIEGVVVCGTGMAFGAVAFDDFGWLGTGGWDEGVSREGAVRINDTLDGPGPPGPRAFGCPGLAP